jgi:hypothetical protein
MAIIDLIGKKYKNNVTIIPRENITIFNSYDYTIEKKYYFKDGDFIIHFAGFRNKELIDKINFYKDKINKNNGRHLFDELVKYIAKNI